MSFSKPLHLLIVEDNPGDLALFKEYLQQTKLKITCLQQAGSLTAINSLQLQNLDLDFLDVSLPDSNGIDSFQLLSKLIPDVPIIVLSGLSDENFAIKCIALGAQDYLLKDDANEKLIEKSIQFSLERKRHQDEMAKYQRTLQKQLVGATILGQEKERKELERSCTTTLTRSLPRLSFTWTRPYQVKILKMVCWSGAETIPFMPSRNKKIVALADASIIG